MYSVSQGCPCGYFTVGHGCRCPSTKVAVYLGRISGPLLDRIDLHVAVSAVPYPALRAGRREESSARIRARVEAARRRQRERLAPLGLSCNVQLRHRDLSTVCRLTDAAATLLKRAMQAHHLSARSHDKLLRVARTIADLAGADRLGPDHLAEAIRYRSLDRQWWA